MCVHCPTAVLRGAGCSWLHTARANIPKAFREFRPSGAFQQKEFPKKAAQGVSVPMASSQGLSAETGGVGLGDASEVQVSRLIVGLKSHCSVTLWGTKESTTQF